MHVLNYVVEFLHAIGDDFDGVCMYWIMLLNSYMLLATTLLVYACIELCYWILTCYWWRLDGVNMYWKMLMLIIDDLCEHMHCCLVICSCIHDWWWRILYPYWRQPDFISILTLTMMFLLHHEVTILATNIGTTYI